MENPKRVPISRMNKFISENDIENQKLMAREYVEGNLNFRVILYSVDTHKTNNDDVYGEVSPSQIRFFPPVELSCLVTLKPADTKAYNSNAGSLAFQEWGNLEFSVFIDHLKELGAEIKKGDFIGYPVSPTYVKYFEVVNPGKVNLDNDSLFFGREPVMRHVVATPVDAGVFNGL